jgi:hypothetical protein
MLTRSCFKQHVPRSSARNVAAALVVSAFILLFTSILRATPAVPLTLGWNASPSSVSGYRLYYGPVGSQTTNRVDVGNSLSTTLYSLTATTNYFFFVSAYNAAGAESPPSNFVDYRPPAIARLQLTNVGIAGVKVQFLAGSNTSCHVEYTASLNPPQWQMLAAATADSKGNIAVTDPLPTHPRTRFYRAVEP